MNLFKKSLSIAVISFFCCALQATTQSYTRTMRLMAANSVGCLLSGITTLGIIHFYLTRSEKAKRIRLDVCTFLPTTLAACYTSYRTGLSAYTLYKKADALKKAVSKDSENLTAQEKLNIEKNVAIDTNSTHKTFNV